MRVLLIILSFAGANISFGQQSLDQLRDKAFDFYLYQKKFDSSLFYYQLICHEFPNKVSAYIANQIADCYLGLGDTANAEKYYLQCLSFYKNLDSLGFSQVHSCEALSNICYNRKQFREALLYLEYTKTKYRPLRFFCLGGTGYGRRLEFAYKKSLCYYGLGNKDSVISEMAPLIFRPYDNIYLDSLQFEEISRFFVKTVFEVYGASQARDDLQRAIGHIVYKPNYDTSSSWIMFSVDCSIVFAKTKIELDDIGAMQVKKMGEIPEFFTREKLLKEFMESPAYRYIMAGNGWPLSLIKERALLNPGSL